MRAIFLMLAVLALIGFVACIACALFGNVYGAEIVGALTVTFAACAIMVCTSEHEDFSLIGGKE